MRRLLPAILCLGLSACGQKVTGLYMESDAEGVVTLALVETDDHRVTGRAEFDTMNADGQTNDRANVVTGAVGDGVITIDLQPRDILSRAMSLSGVMHGRTLTLDGTGSQGHFRLILGRTSQEAVQAAMAELATRAQTKRQAIELAREQVQQAKEREASIQKTVETSLADDAFVTGQDEVFDKLKRVEDAFRSATVQMKAKFKQEAETYGDGQAEVERSQLYVGANQISIQADQLHLRLAGAMRAFQQKAEALERPTIDQEQSCHRAHPPTAQDSIPDEQALWNTDCLILRESAAKFRSAKAAISVALTHAEQTWLKEKAEQDQVLMSSQSIQ